MIVVGDVDPAWIEARIAAQFGDWRGRARPCPPRRPTGSTRPARPPFAPSRRRADRPGRRSPRSRRAAPAMPSRRAIPSFLQWLGADMLAARVLGHRGGDRPFMDAEAAVGDYYRTARIARFSVRALDGDWRMALGVAEQELRCALGTASARTSSTSRSSAKASGWRRSPRRKPAPRWRTGSPRCRHGHRPHRPRPRRRHCRLSRPDPARRGQRRLPRRLGRAGRLVHVAHDRPIEGGEAALPRAWAAGAPCPVTAR